MTDFVAYRSTIRLVLLFCAAMMFFSGGLWMVGVIGDAPNSDRYSPVMITIFGWAAVLISALLAAVFASSIFGRKDILRIGPTGILFRSWSKEVIPWSEIANVAPWEFGKHTNVVLKLRDPERFPGKQPAAFFARANRSVMPGDVPIQLTFTNQTIATTLSAIEKFRT